MFRTFWQKFSAMLVGKYRLFVLLAFSLICQCAHFAICPFPNRDPLTYLHALHYWNVTGNFASVLEKFPKFGLLLFTFLPLKWAEQIGISLYPASVVYMILMSLVSVWAFYRIVLLLTDDPVKAMWSGAFLAVHPMILLYAGNLLRDTPYLMFCLLLALCLIHAIRDRKWNRYLLCGILLAMCLLSRFESWELLFLFPLSTFFYMWKLQYGKREILIDVICVLAGFAATAALFLCLVGDNAVLYEKGSRMFLSFFPEWMRP